MLSEKCFLTASSLITLCVLFIDDVAFFAENAKKENALFIGVPSYFHFCYQKEEMHRLGATYMVDSIDTSLENIIYIDDCPMAVCIAKSIGIHAIMLINNVYTINDFNKTLNYNCLGITSLSINPFIISHQSLRYKPCKIKHLLRVLPGT